MHTGIELMFVADSSALSGPASEGLNHADFYRVGDVGEVVAGMAEAL